MSPLGSARAVRRVPDLTPTATFPDLTPTLVAFLAYILLVFAAAWPLSGDPRAYLPGAPSGDTGVYVWNNWVFRHEIFAHRSSPLWTDHILYPGPPVDLALHNYTLFQDAIAFALAPLTGQVAAFNLTWLLMQAISGLGVFLLARRHTRSASLAWLAGALFACSPTMIARSTAHQSLVAAAPLAFFLLFVLRAADRRSIVDAAAAGACAAWAALCDAYYGIYCVLLLLVTAAVRTTCWQPREGSALTGRSRTVLAALTVVPAAIVAFVLATGGGSLDVLGVSIRIRTLYTPVLILTVLVAAQAAMAVRARGWWRIERRIDRFRLAQLGAGVFVCALLLSPIINTARLRIQSGGSLQERVLWRSSPPGVDLLAFALPNPNHPLAPSAFARFLTTRPDGYPENVASIPWVAIVVIAVGIRRFTPPRLFVALLVFFALMALGPFVTVGQVNTHVPGPWALLRYVPVLGAARTPTRFAIPMLIAVAVLFAWALDRLAMRRLFVAVTAAALAFELWPVPRVTASAHVPAIYSTIAVDRDDVSVLELPFGIWDGTSQTGFANTATQYYQTAHEKRLVGGYLSRIPPRRLRAHLAFPAVRLFAEMSERKPAAPNLAEAAREDAEYFLQQSRVRYVVIDPRLASRELREKAIDLLRLRLVQRADGLELYTTTSVPPPEASSRTADPVFAPPSPPGAAAPRAQR